MVLRLGNKAWAWATAIVLWSATAIAQVAPVEVVYASTRDASTFEPTQVSGGLDHTASMAIFGSLVFNFDSLTGTFAYFPYLADRFEAIDDLTWRVELRPGLTFHNGEPLNAAAVKFSYDRIRHPEFPSSRAFKRLPIDRVEIVDELTVDIHTLVPIPALPTFVVRGDGSIVAPGHYADRPPWANVATTAWNPVGAGPFRFVSHSPDDRLVLEYHDGFIDPRGIVPNWDRLVIRVIPETSTLIAELLRGEIDIAPIPGDMVSVIEAAPGLRVVFGENTSRTACAFNLEAHEALQDKRVRQAIRHAVDIDALVDAFTFGAGVPIATLVNPPNTHPDLRPYAYDPERARQLLAEAGYGSGFPISIEYHAAAFGDVAAALESYLRAIGIQVEAVRQLEFASVWTPRWNEGTLAGLHCYSHGGNEGTAEADLWSKHPNRANQSLNWTGSRVDEFVDLYSRIGVTVNPEERLRLAYALQELTYDEAVYLPLFREPRIMAVSDRIEFFEPYPAHFNEDFIAIRVRE